MIEITKRKSFLPITEDLGRYLDQFDRRFTLPATYADLREFQQSYPLYDKSGHPTHWSTVMYVTSQRQFVRKSIAMVMVFSAACAV
jgi:hypothetical protein